jgi:hypothetical protein
LKQVLEDRAIRRLKRRGLSEEINKISWEKKCEAKSSKREIERLKQELEEKDLEMQSMRDKSSCPSQMDVESGVPLATNATFRAKFHELEQQVIELEATLREKETAAMEDTNWTMAARDPFNFDEDDDMMITNYDQDFTMNDELMTTPTRLNTSFPSPPSTMPNTPCKLTSTISAGTQATLPIPDPEKDALKSQLESLQSEMSQLTSKIALHEDDQSRLAGKLAEFLPVNESHDHSSLDSALDAVLTQLALSQSHALEQSHAFSALGSEITTLGFSPGSSPDDMIAAIAAQFRQARLDLEYLTPGEVVEAFENEKLLEMLISRIRILVKRTKEGDDKIDQYHEQEISLRQQLNARVDALQDVQKELSVANSVADGLRSQVSEREVSNERLQRALQSYRDEVSGLEKLIERMDKEERLKQEILKSEVKEAGDRLETEILKHDTTRADAEGKDMIITELERRLHAAIQARAEVEEKMAVLATEKDCTIQQQESARLEREKGHGDALALRDARVSELRGEIGRLNEALKVAYSSSLNFERENATLKAQVDAAKISAQVLLQRMRGVIDGFDQPGTEPGASTLEPDGENSPVDASTAQTVVRRGRFLDAGLARRGGKRKRRYDSGLDFLEEEEGEEELSIEIEA